MEAPPETQTTRPAWKFWYLLPMLLPSVVYLVLYPVLYRSALEDALRNFILRGHPDIEWAHTHILCGIGTAVQCGFISLLVMLAVTLLLARSQAGKSIRDGGRLLGGCFLLIIVNGAICFGGCSLGDYNTQDLRTLPEHLRRSETTTEIWRASTANGDKPGIGIELQREAGKTACVLYLLDPDHPHDFEWGHERPVTLTKTTPDKLEFTVCWSDSESENLTLRLPDGILAAQFRGEMSDGIAGHATTLYEFRRVGL